MKRRGRSIKLGVGLTSGVTLALAGPASLGAAASSGAPSSPVSGNFQQSPQVLSELDGAPTAATAAGDPLAEFQVSMLQQFPDSFGGVVQNADGTFSVMEVGSDSVFESTAQSLFDQLPAEFGVAVDSANLELQFRSVAHSLASLYSIKQQIDQSISQNSTASAPYGVYGTALDIWDSQVLVYADSNSPANITTQQLTSQYGSAVKLTVQQPELQLQDRTDDSSPWSSSDEIVAQVGGGNETACTLGFGVHGTSSGAQYSLSAGHCGVYTWYNTDAYSPTFNKGTLVGTTDRATTSGLDTQLIPDSSTYTMWQGAVGSAYKTTITGYADPPQGASVCREGAFAGEQCGTIKAVDQTVVIGGESLQNIDISNGLPGADGDSGGPLLYSSVFGPLAAGSIVGAMNGDGYYEEIDALLFSWSAYEGEGITVDTNSAP